MGGPRSDEIPRALRRARGARECAPPRFRPRPDATPSCAAPATLPALHAACAASGSQRAALCEQPMRDAMERVLGRAATLVDERYGVVRQLAVHDVGPCDP